MLDSTIKKILRYILKKCVQIYIDNKEFISKLIIDEQCNEVLNEIRNIGQGVQVNGDITVTHPLMIIIGNNVHIGHNAFFYSRGGLTIGDNVRISRNVTVYTSDYNFDGKLLPYDDEYIDKPVFIAKNVCIGMNVSIAPGVTIGEGAVISLGTIVTKDVPPYSIVGHNHYKLLKYRNQKHYRELEQRKAFYRLNDHIADKSEHKVSGKNALEMGKNLFFILSTGRSGSTSIALILSEHPDITCEHEPNGQLIRLSTEYMHKVKSREVVKEELKRMYIDAGRLVNQYYGESDQKLSNLIDILAELFPEAKFIWLIRKASSVVNSTFSRGWFSDNDLSFIKNEHYSDELEKDKFFNFYTYYRLQGDKTGEFLSEQWESMSSFERNCWYWAYWNRLIEKQLTQLPDNKWLMVKLEELDTAFEKIINFLGCRKFEFKTMKANEALPSYKLIKKSSWKKEENNAYEKWCNPLMEKWYT